jgi:hypothetical protein
MPPEIVLSVNGRDGLESAGAAQTQAHRTLELVVRLRDLLHRKIKILI